MDGTTEWVPEKKIHHESDILNRFESEWWKDKRRKEKEFNNFENIIKIAKDDDIEEDTPGGNQLEVKLKAKLKGKKINIYNNLNNEIFDDLEDNKHDEDLNNSNVELINGVFKINMNPHGTTEDDLSVLEKKEVIPFKNKKRLKHSVRFKPILKKRKKLANKNPKPILKSKNQNVNLEQIMLNNKRERVDDNLEINQIEPNKITYPTIKIIDYEDSIDTEYLVEWKQREDGTIPTNSFVDEKTAQTKYADLLIDFLRKTLKE